MYILVHPFNSNREKFPPTISKRKTRTGTARAIVSFIDTSRAIVKLLKRIQSMERSSFR